MRNGTKIVEVYGAAMRGRYNSNGKTEQQIEIRDDEISNAITTVQKRFISCSEKSLKPTFQVEKENIIWLLLEQF